MGVDLSKAKILLGLTAPQRARIAALAEVRKFRSGECVFAEDTPGDELYFVLSGRVEIRIRLRQDEQRIATHKPGDSFGEFAAMDRSRRSATAAAASDMEVAALSGAAFYKLLDDEPAIGYVVMRNLCNVLCDRLKNANLQWRNAVYWG